MGKHFIFADIGKRFVQQITHVLTWDCIPIRFNLRHRRKLIFHLATQYYFFGATSALCSYGQMRKQLK